MGAETEIEISSFTGADIMSCVGELAGLIHACVHDGASIGYVLPFSMAEAEAFWMKKVLPAVEDHTRVLLVARRATQIVGSVQLDHDTPPNQPHRAEVRKLMVHPGFRRRGIARLLMGRIEERARQLPRSLLTLDTRSGDAAEPLYTSLGYVTVGRVPGFCLDPFHQQLDATTIMYKVL